MFGDPKQLFRSSILFSLSTLCSSATSLLGWPHFSQHMGAIDRVPAYLTGSVVEDKLLFAGSHPLFTVGDWALGGFVCGRYAGRGLPLCQAGLMFRSPQFHVSVLPFHPTSPSFSVYRVRPYRPVVCLYAQCMPLQKRLSLGLMFEKSFWGGCQGLWEINLFAAISGRAGNLFLFPWMLALRRVSKRTLMASILDRQLFEKNEMLSAYCRSAAVSPQPVPISQMPLEPCSQAVDSVYPVCASASQIIDRTATQPRFTQSSVGNRPIRYRPAMHRLEAEDGDLLPAQCVGQPMPGHCIVLRKSRYASEKVRAQDEVTSSSATDSAHSGYAHYRDASAYHGSPSPAGKLFQLREGRSGQIAQDTASEYTDVQTTSTTPCTHAPGSHCRFAYLKKKSQFQPAIEGHRFAVIPSPSRRIMERTQRKTAQNLLEEHAPTLQLICQSQRESIEALQREQTVLKNNCKDLIKRYHQLKAEKSELEREVKHWKEEYDGMHSNFILYQLLHLVHRLRPDHRTHLEHAVPVGAESSVSVCNVGAEPMTPSVRKKAWRPPRGAGSKCVAERRNQLQWGNETERQRIAAQRHCQRHAAQRAGVHPKADVAKGLKRSRFCAQFNGITRSLQGQEPMVSEPLGQSVSLRPKNKTTSDRKIMLSPFPINKTKHPNV